MKIYFNENYNRIKHNTSSNRKNIRVEIKKDKQ